MIRVLIVFGIFILMCLSLIHSPLYSQQRRDVVLFDFEDGKLDGWEVTGKNFLVGNRPLHRDSIANWERGPVGFHGNYYLETGHDHGRHFNKNGGGTLKSPQFRINRNFLNFYLAGQVNPGVRVFLEIEGKVVREAFGNNFYDLILRGWDVRQYRNQRARFVVEDKSSLRSLIRVDHVFLSDKAPPAPEDWVEIPDRQRSSIVVPGEFVRVFGNEQITHGDWLVERATLVLGPDDRWHIFAQVIEAGNVWNVRNPGVIIHAVSDSLLHGWSYQGIAMQAEEASGEQFLLDPFVLVHEDKFYMFYVGSGQLWSGWYNGPEGNINPWHMGQSGDYGPNSMFLAVSQDGANWQRIGAADPRRPGRIFTEKPFGHTPFVSRINDRWVMYYASAEDETVFSKHTIGYRFSDDLINWGDRKHALIDWSLSDNTEAAGFGRHIPASPWPEHSFFTNPVVFSRGNTWHLWAGPIDNSNLSRYHCLRIYTGKDPFSFSDHLKAKQENKRVFVDGGGKPFRDPEGNWFIFHTNNMSGGVWIAPLHWNDGEENGPSSIDKPVIH